MLQPIAQYPEAIGRLVGVIPIGRIQERPERMRWFVNWQAFAPVFQSLKSGAHKDPYITINHDESRGCGTIDWLAVTGDYLAFYATIVNDSDGRRLANAFPNPGDVRECSWRISVETVESTHHDGKRIKELVSVSRLKSIGVGVGPGRAGVAGTSARFATLKEIREQGHAAAFGLKGVKNGLWNICDAMYRERNPAPSNTVLSASANRSLKQAALKGLIPIGRTMGVPAAYVLARIQQQNGDFRCT